MSIIYITNIVYITKYTLLLNKIKGTCVIFVYQTNYTININQN